MEFWSAAVIIVTIGCVTGVITTAIDKFASGKRRRLEIELKAERKQTSLTQRRVSELEEDNQRLRQQLEWHTRLLTAQGNERSRLSEHSEPEPSQRL